jgi:hypothetical protein
MMKRIFINKMFLLPAATVIVLLLAVLMLQLVFSFRAVKATQQDLTLAGVNKGNAGWSDWEVNRLKKNSLWYEQLLVMAKNDSIGLIINLNDSVVQINLKGMYLVQSQIIKQYPADFLNNINEETYTKYASVSSIMQESANFPKKPIKKVSAYTPQDDNKEDQNLKANDKPLSWSFTTRNNLNVVITGVAATPDSSLSFYPTRDLLKYRLRDILKHGVPEKYTPTLYLWLSDKDAKSIYRAVASRGEVLFRN